MKKQFPLQDWLRRIELLHPSNIELGLDRVELVFQRLMPTKPEAKVITVAGTNGKGSTVECLTQCLLVQGYRVGTYTSPHLIRFNERVVIDSKQVSDEQLVIAFEAVEHARQETPLTYFEFTTLAGLWIFAQSHLDYWVLEVGLGGRLDAVNVVDADAAIITSIGLDHQDWLGDTREQIAIEKCGIMRIGAFAVCSDPNPPNNLSELAVDTQFRQLGVDYHWREVDPASGKSNTRTAQWHSSDDSRSDLIPPDHCSTDNLAGALAALDLMGVLPSEKQLNRVFQQWRLAGRQQIIPGDVDWWLDVAHNPDSARFLAQSLEADAHSGESFLVIGMLADKAVAEVIEILLLEVDHCIVVELDSSRALPVSELLALLPEKATPHVSVASVAAACAIAQARAKSGDRVIVTGSFHCVGPALAWLGL